MLVLFNVVFLQSRVDEDCITELAVHYGKTQAEMKAMVEEVTKLASLLDLQLGQYPAIYTNEEPCRKTCR